MKIEKVEIFFKMISCRMVSSSNFIQFQLNSDKLCEQSNKFLSRSPNETCSENMNDVIMHVNMFLLLFNKHASTTKFYPGRLHFVKELYRIYMYIHIIHITRAFQPYRTQRVYINCAYFAIFIF